MTFEIVAFGVKEATRMLDGIAANAKNTRPAMEEIYLTMLDIEDEMWAMTGARGGHGFWTRLAYSTVLWKARHNYRPEILRATDKLKTAMTTYRHPDQYVRIETSKIVFAPNMSRIPYGRIQQKGGRVKQGFKPTLRTDLRTGKVRKRMLRNWVVIPARPYIAFTDTDAEAFGREIMKHLTSRRRGGGSVGVSFG